MKIFVDRNLKIIKSRDFNNIFNMETGYSMTWGRTKEENPEYCPYGPLIADIEITTKCSGPGGKLCPFCYKGNTLEGFNMSLDTFKVIFNKLPKTIQQVAFGADSSLEMNPDIWGIMDYCLENNVIPNITCADITSEVALKLSERCGAVAISLYGDKDLCYDSVKRLTDLGMTQINIHSMVSENTYERCLDVIDDIQSDPRLSKMNAIVFLSLKRKGRGVTFKQLSEDKFKVLVDKCLQGNIKFGFDSCSYQKFVKSIEGHEMYNQFLQMAEPCESARMSAYIDVHGNYYPCSFCEGIGEGISVVDCNDFLEDIWNSPRNINFRNIGIKNMKIKRACQVYEI